jgi:hypothetical protein
MKDRRYHGYHACWKLNPKSKDICSDDNSNSKDKDGGDPFQIFLGTKHIVGYRKKKITKNKKEHSVHSTFNVEILHIKCGAGRKHPRELCR